MKNEFFCVRMFITKKQLNGEDIMIFNGNYTYDTCDEYKDILVESFIEYYGEQYRDSINKKLDNLILKTYHTSDYIEKYYDKFICRFREEILDNFVDKFKLKRNETLDELVFGKNKSISESKLTLACDGGIDVKNNIHFSEDGKKLISRYRKKIFNELNIDGTDEEKYLILNELKKGFLDSVKDVEKKYDLDVFKDIQRMEENKNESIKKFYENIKYSGYIVSEKEKDILKEPDFDYTQTYKLPSNNVLFSDDLCNPGIMNSFTTFCSERLDKGERIEKDIVIVYRLLYLISFADTRFKYLTPEKINEIYFKLKASWPNKLNAEDEINLIKEYEYQKKQPELISDRINNEEYPHKYLKNDWKKGNFVPAKVADKLEEIRTDCANFKTWNTIYEKNDYSEDFDERFENFALKYYEDGSILDPNCMVYINEDWSDNFKSYFGIVIHEFNHVLAHDIPYEINDKNFKNKESVGLRAYGKTKDMKVDEIIKETDNLNIEEYVNENQAKEIFKIFTKKCKQNGKATTLGDKVLEKGEDFSCLYDLFGLVAEDFYKLYHDELKTLTIDKDYNMYFKYDLPTNIKETISNTIKTLYYKNFKKKQYYNDGLVDIKNVEKLSKLIDKLKVEVIDELDNRGYSSEFLLNKNWSNYPADLQLKLRRVLIEKSKIMEDIAKDNKNQKAVSNLSEELVLDEDEKIL